ncbi:MAG: glycerol-3-phosphate dehydrogenase/oxidase [Pyrinomonadaceae bacterium]|nr:glycerol-3-phosphate dehydrogenase/oxidase [Acidobacteriota bacterium]MBP7374863.1 glycerol-3-phosphate dehydrogenase/oxidase [Pyrinomonadaceae bacterium]
MDRNQILERVRSRTTSWDIVVVGGGSTGVGCAVDAASRGFDVLLVEQSDFGKGTSSRSTKLVHGGVRYLAQGNISLVREALKERGVLLRNAPHVVHRQEFIVPCYSRWQKFYYGVGLRIYDLLSGKYSLGKSRILSRSETIERLPTVIQAGLAGGVLYSDGQFDDTRLLIDMARTAHEQGAAVLNYARVSSLLKSPEGKVSGIEFEDVLAGENFAINAKAVINATGAFCDAVRTMSDESSKPIVTLSQGIHLVFDRSFLPGDSAIMIPKTGDGRVLFCIPWHGRTLVGTTDTPIPEAELEPNAFDFEIDFVLETVGQYLTTKPARRDILSLFTGIRPLVASSSTRNTASLSRGHTIEINDSDLLTITGGKWTTYRHMAEDAVDQASRIANLSSRPSVTEKLKINGPQPFVDTEPLHSELPYTRGDVIRAVREEMAQTVEDVLARRTRALFLNTANAIEIAPLVAKIMASELGKDKTWLDAEVGRFSETAKRYMPKKQAS